MKTVPVIRYTDMSEKEKRALLIADNRIAEGSTWDLELVCENLEIISDVDCDFDLTVTGFESHEIDHMIIGTQTTKEIEENIPSEVTMDSPVVTKLGDQWKMGNHKVQCGNALESESYEKLMGTDIAQICITDPPYNVPIKGHVSGLGEKQHDEFVMATGEMTRDQFKEFLRKALSLVNVYGQPGSLVYVFMDWRHIHELITVGENIFDELKQLCTWIKSNSGMGSFYRSQHELVCIFKKSGAAHINNFELGQFGRHRSNVWEYSGMNSTSSTSRQLLKLHPTVKPVALLADVLLDASKPNGIVLDPFGGSGSTLIAAEHTNRRARLIELDPKYVDVTIRRWKAYSGLDAVLESTGQTFTELLAVITKSKEY